MHSRNISALFHVLGLAVLVTVAGLWSWNTLSELFGLPEAHYTHALAAFCLLALLRWLFVPGLHGWHRGHGIAAGTRHH